MSDSPSKFRPLGRTDDACPYCRAPFAKRPERKTTCPSCKGIVFARKRPFDEAKVLLTDVDALAVEEDWKLHYEMTSREPRPVSPEWRERMEIALNTEHHANPEVERIAREAMRILWALCAGGVAPQDATDQVLASVLDLELRGQVEHRIWQLQVRAMGGAESGGSDVA